jgi:multidrug efflux pump subunit AcrA (membrane-fusion protein)
VATVETEGMPIVSVDLSEIDVSRVQIGQKATISIDSIPDKTFAGKVIGVDRIGETVSGVTQYPAIIQLDSSSDEILPNLTASASIIIERKNDVLLVPSGVIQLQGGQNYAKALVDGQQQFVPVEIGLTSDTQTEIISGLDEGDLVITGTTTIDSSGASPFGGSGMGGMMRMPR